MATALKDVARLLPSMTPLRRKLSKAELDKLTKGFAKRKGGEPGNSGVKKSVGLKMIKAAANHAEKRVRAAKKSG